MPLNADIDHPVVMRPNPDGRVRTLDVLGRDVGLGDICNNRQGAARRRSSQEAQQHRPEARMRLVNLACGRPMLAAAARLPRIAVRHLSLAWPIRCAPG